MHEATLHTHRGRYNLEFGERWISHAFRKHFSWDLYKCQRATSSSFPCMVVHIDLFLNFSFSNSKPWNLSIMKHKLCWRILLVCIVTQSYLTLCDPMDCSLLGFPVHGIILARTLEWVVISYFRGSSWPRDQALFSCISSINRWFFFFFFFTILPIGKALKDHEDILSVSLVPFFLLGLESCYRKSITVFPCSKAKALPRKQIQDILHSMVPSEIRQLFSVYWFDVLASLVV